MYGCNPSIGLFEEVDGFRAQRIWFEGTSAAAGGLVHFNCHNQELTPFRPAGISLVIEKLLVGCDTTEDALAAAFCLLRCVRPGLKTIVICPQPPQNISSAEQVQYV